MFFSIILLIIGCEKDPNSTSESISSNTLNNPSIGNPDEWGNIDDYFNLEDEINLKFYKYNSVNYNTNILFNPEEDTLRLRSFEEFQVVPSVDIDSYLTQDITFNQTSVYSDSLWVFSTGFQNIDSLVWNVADELFHKNQYYTKKKSKGYERDSTLVEYEDEFDSLIVFVQVDTTTNIGQNLLTSGFSFMDTTATESNSTIEYGDRKTGTEFFEVPGLRVGLDMIMARVNTDCNDDGQYTDEPETVDGSIESCTENSECGAGYKCHAGEVDSFCYIDRGNQLFDVQEPGFTQGEAGWTRNDIFKDRNCNGERDDAELTSAEIDMAICMDTYRGQWITVNSITFCDVGNGQYDDAETYVDDNEDGECQSNELYQMSEDGIMTSLLVDYLDVNNPRVMDVIYPQDSLTTRWGVKYTGLIEDFVMSETVSYSYDDIVRKKTINSHPTIQYFEEEMDSPYTVAKSEWDDNGAQYDYHMYRKEASGDIVKLTYPEYFKPYGYHDPALFDDYFWRDSVFVNDTIFYTHNGFLRDGEYYRKEREVSISGPEVLLADYVIEEIYEVEKDILTILPYIDEENVNGGVECFKVKRGVTMTMLGTGVEYYEENNVWLGKGLGIVKEDIEYNWTGDDKSGLSRLELLKDFSGSGGEGDSERAFYFPNKISVNEFERMGEDPYKYNRTGFVQRVGK